MHAQFFKPIFRWPNEDGSPNAGVIEDNEGNLYGTTSNGGSYGLGTIFKVTHAGEYKVLWSFRSGSGSSRSALLRARNGTLYGVAGYSVVHGLGMLYSITPNGEYRELHSFNGESGSYPEAALIQGSDGALYGSTTNGGEHGSGTIFRATTEGEVTVLHSFNGSGGSYPRGELVQGSDGSLYGTTMYGGAHGCGTVFRITSKGEYHLLYSFDSSNGHYPWAGLVIGSDGNLYGTTYSGGEHGAGTVFRLTPAGEHTVLHSFNGVSEVCLPRATLVLGDDGRLYGTADGGESGRRGIFRITTNGEFEVIRRFSIDDGYGLRTKLFKRNDGAFYGTALSEGGDTSGNIFRITASGEISIVHQFKRYGRTSTSTLVPDGNGNFYGLTVDGGNSIFRITEDGTYSVLHTFDRTELPVHGSLVLGPDSNLYGLTDGNNQGDVKGTIFRLTPAGSYELLHAFNGTDGSIPRARLVQGSDGNFHGITRTGGASNYGTVFKITPDGKHTVVHSFDGTTGRYPTGELVEGANGNFYGITGPDSDGVSKTFRITSTGSFKLLHSSVSRFVHEELVRGSNGEIYGSSTYGANGNGSIFRITSDDTFQVLHTFNGTDGKHPIAKMTPGKGVLYGTTREGGISGSGTVFQITENGQFSVLHHFNEKDGERPETPLFHARDGSIFGTCSFGGANGYGTVFRIDGWRFSVVHSFDGTNGSSPVASLALGRDGHLWGLTVRNTVSDSGVIYQIHQGPLPETLPATGITSTAATLHGKVDFEGRITFSGIEYGMEPDLTNAMFASFGDLFGYAGPQSFSVRLDSLLPSTKYYYRAYARNASNANPQRGSILSFTTNSAWPQVTAITSKGAAVSGAGIPDSGIPSGATWRYFGVPASGGSNDQLAFTARLRGSGGRMLAGIFAGNELSPLLVAKNGDSAPGLPEGAVFTSFKDPLFTESGKMVFIAIASGKGVPAKGIQGIWVKEDALSNSPVQLIASQGEQAAGVPVGALWKTFTSVALSESGAVTFTATLEQRRGGVSTDNDTGLWQVTSSGITLLLREGQDLTLNDVTRKVKSFAALSAKGSISGMEQPTSIGVVPVRVTFHDSSQALLSFITGYEPWVVVQSGDVVVGPNGNERFHSFGSLTLNGSDGVAFRATIQTDTGNGDSTNDSRIFTLVFDSETFNYVARAVAGSGQPAPGFGLVGELGTFESFSDPIINDQRQLLFSAKTSRNVKGLWWRKIFDQGDQEGEQSELQLLASTGRTPVPDIHGARFQDFTFVALPDGGRFGPMFVAKIAGKNIRAENDVGLWAVDSAGTLRILLREGQMLEGKMLRRFDVLGVVRGSSTQIRSYNIDGQVLCRAFFTDGSGSLLKVQIP